MQGVGVSNPSPSPRRVPEPIRIAALIDTAQVSGPGRQLAALARSLQSRGVDLCVVTFHRHGRAASPYVDYLKQQGVDCAVLPENGPLDAGLIVRLRKALDELAPSVVQTHGYRTTALAFSLRCTGSSWPWIAFSHGETSENIKIRFYNWLERQLLGAADRVVVMSRQQQEALPHLGPKSCVVHNAVIPLPASSSRVNQQLPSDLGRTSSHPLLGVLGRLSPEKGVDVFLRACRELVDRRVPFSAVVAGDGPERGNLEALRDGLGLTDRVHFVGVITAVEQLYSKLDLVVIPSRSEGLPNVLLEALRADVPVVATHVGAIPDVLASSSAGILARPDSPRALADAIAQALQLRENSESREARREITQRFSLERRVEAHLALYSDVLQTRDTLH